MVLLRNDKRKIIDEFKTMVTTSKGLIVWDYSGLSSKKSASLQMLIKQNHGINRVYKNRLAKIALAELGIEGFDKFLKSSSSFLFLKDENYTALKELDKFLKGNPNNLLKAGYIDNHFYDSAAITELANLPSYNELLSILLSALNGPITKLAYSLNEVSKEKSL